MESAQKKRMPLLPGLWRLLALLILVAGLAWAGWWLWDTFRPASPVRWQARMDAAAKAQDDFCTQETHYLAAIKEGGNSAKTTFVLP